MALHRMNCKIKCDTIHIDVKPQSFFLRLYADFFDFTEFSIFCQMFMNGAEIFIKNNGKSC